MCHEGSKASDVDVTVKPREFCGGADGEWKELLPILCPSLRSVYFELRPSPAVAVLLPLAACSGASARADGSGGDCE